MDARKFDNHVTARTSVRTSVGPYMLADAKCLIYHLHFTVSYAIHIKMDGQTNTSGENEW